MPQEHSPDELNFTNKAPDTPKTKLDEEIDNSRSLMTKAYAQMMDARSTSNKQNDALFSKIYRDEEVRYENLLKKRKDEGAISMEDEKVAERFERPRFSCR
jgi:hypothetical protein